MGSQLNIAGSSKGRTSLSESENFGSIPSPAAKKMNKNKILLVVIITILIFVLIAYLKFFDKTALVENSNSLNSSITYTNFNYGFDFSLPVNWKGYSIINDLWKGNMLTNASSTNGPKLLIRNPKWTDSNPYEDLPILVFTISQWNKYLAEDFSISAAPIKASELARNNKYVFALPPRWDFDYSLDFKEAQDIFASKPIHTFDIVPTKSN